MYDYSKGDPKMGGGGNRKIEKKIKLTAYISTRRKRLRASMEDEEKLVYEEDDLDDTQRGTMLMRASMIKIKSHSIYC